MKRTWRIFLVFLISLAAGVCCSQGCGQLFSLQEKPRPNIFLFLVDTLRADHLGCYGYPRATSPEIDAFARDAVLFSSARSQASWTRPSVATLFTGNFSSSHGVISRNDELTDDNFTMAESLAAAGYDTKAFVTNFNVFSYYGFHHGFNDYFEYNSSDSDGRHYTKADMLVDSVLPHLEHDGGAPLFFYIHSMDPHYPYLPPAPFDSLFRASDSDQITDDTERYYTSNRNAYDGEIAFTDYHFGRFINRLKELDLYNDSLIIFLSDHGEAFGEHGTEGHGYTLYEEQIHVPLIIKMPGGRGGNTAVGEPVGLVDIFPTICDYLGIRHGRAMDGASFLPLLEGRAGQHHPRSQYAEEQLDDVKLRSLITNGYKIIDTQAPEPGVEIYDLAHDPGETRDIADGEPLLRKQMLRSIQAFSSELRSGFFLRITNEDLLESSNVIDGYIRVSGAEIVEFESGNAEDGDSITLSGDSTEIRFHFILANKANIKPPPGVLVDVDSVRFTAKPVSCEIEMVINVNGSPAPANRLQLGSGDDFMEDQAGFPMVIRSDDPRVQSGGWGTPGLRRQHQGPLIRFYSIPQIRKNQLKLDAKQEKLMRDLKYIK